jgi:CheY-like chemotaxis protein
MAGPVKRILIVEDDALIAMLLEDMLMELGHDIVAVAARLPQALEMVDSLEFDAAILDLSLAGQNSYPVADALEVKNIPYLFATGYGAGAIDGAYADRQTLKKPYQMDDLEKALSALHA